MTTFKPVEYLCAEAMPFDIAGNLQALDACLEYAQAQRAERLVM